MYFLGGENLILNASLISARALVELSLLFGGTDGENRFDASDKSGVLVLRRHHDLSSSNC